MDVVGKVVATHEHVAGGSLQKWRLVEIAPPLRLRDFVTGEYADGWTGAAASYNHFASDQGDGRVRIVVNRQTGVPGQAIVKLGPIVIGDDNQPHIGEPAVVKRVDLPANGTKTLVLPAPGADFRVEVQVTPTFRAPGDNRDLGAKFTYTFVPSRKAAHR